jgi:hypothetical protein
MTDDEAEREYRRSEIDKGWASVARLADVKVEHRTHRDDGHLTDWAATMPKKPPPPPTLTADEIRRIVRDEMAEQPRALTPAAIEALVEHVLGKHSVLTPKAIVPILHELRQQLRSEIAKAHMPNRPAEEFFYLDADGTKQDADLHNPILRAVDYPIDEKIMGPIRARHRAKWLAEQKAKRAARIIDLPTLPLMRSRRA